MEDNKNQLSIELRPDLVPGYSNLAIISHSRSEFVIDFASMLPGHPKPQVGNRIIMTPEHAKRLMNALVDNIQKFESQFGQISLGNVPKGTFNLEDFGPLGGGAKS